MRWALVGRLRSRGGRCSHRGRRAATASRGPPPVGAPSSSTAKQPPFPHEGTPPRPTSTADRNPSEPHPWRPTLGGWYSGQRRAEERRGEEVEQPAPGREEVL